MTYMNNIISTGYGRMRLIHRSFPTIVIKAFAFLLILAASSCGGDNGAPTITISNLVPVSIALKIPGQRIADNDMIDTVLDFMVANAHAVIIMPGGVRSVMLSVSGADFLTVSDAFNAGAPGTQVTRTLQIPAGINRNFIIQGYNAPLLASGLPGGAITYTGSILIPLLQGNVAGTPIAVNIPITPTAAAGLLPPVITPPTAITVTATNALGTAATHPTIAAFLSAATALDAIDGAIMPTNNAPTVFPLGSTTVTFSAINSSAKTGIGTAVLTVKDQTPPVLTLTGTASITVLQGGTYIDLGATALDNVDGNNTANIITLNPVNTAVAGVYTVTYNVSDAAGNIAVQVSRRVHVIVLNQAPVPTAPAITAIVGTVGTSQIIPNDPNAGDTHSYVITTLPAKGTATVSATGLVRYNGNAAGADTLTVTITDNGNPALSGIVTIGVTVAAANNPPVVTAPANIIIEATGATTVVALGVATATDVEDGTLVATASNTGPFAVGVHPIVWSATDSGGLTTTANQTVTVKDTTAPIVTAPSAITITAATAQGTAKTAVIIQNFLNAASANDIVDGTITPSNNAPALFPIGTTTVTFTAMDAAGNAALQISRTVTVNPVTVVPVITASANPANLPADGTSLATVTANVSSGAGRTVNFSTTSTSAVLSALSAVTNANGDATITVTNAIIETTQITAATAGAASVVLNIGFINGNADTDGDGIMTNTEILFGSDPTLASSLPAAQVIGQTDSAGVSLANALISSGSVGDVSPYSLNNPEELSIDIASHRLFVADQNNSRILVFQLNTANDISSRKPTSVIGQVDFEHNQSNRGLAVSASTLRKPTGVDYFNDGFNQWLIISDAQNNRVLIYNITAGITKGMAAVVVLGQSTMTGFASGSTSTTLNTPISTRILVFGSKTYLTAADYNNDRVLLWDVSLGINTLTNGQAANVVLGQTTLNTVTLNRTSATLMDGPSGMLQSGNSLFVADRRNHRVLVFNLGVNAINLINGIPANNVIGQSLFTTWASSTTSTGMSFPRNLATYSTGGKTYLLVSDHANSRVMVYNLGALSNGMPASFVYGQTTLTGSGANLTQNGFGAPWGLAVGGNRMFVADDLDEEVLSFDLSTLASQITTRAYAPNAINNLGQNNWIPGMLDGQETSIWDANGANNTGPTGFHSPRETVLGSIQGTQYMFVADYWNDRVLAFAANANGVPLDLQADFVLGQVDFDHQGWGTTQKNFHTPRGLAFDSATTTLYVSDTANNRVLSFDLSLGMSNYLSATVVLGQTGFTTSTTTSSTTPTLTGLNDPQKMVVGNVGAVGNKVRYLFVVDRLFDRILLYNVSAQILNGMAPSFVLGGPNFTTNISGASLNKLSNPRGVDFDPVTQRLFVADGNANRVLIWDLSGGVSNGMNASFILGQTTTTAVASGLSQSQLNYAKDVAFDAVHNVLWISDQNNNRIMGFNMKGSLSNGMNASYLIGQPNFISNTRFSADGNRTAYTLNAPAGLSMGSGGRLIIATETDDRIQIIGP